MELEIIPKQERIPSFDPNAIVVKQISYYPAGTYDKEKITPSFIKQILEEIPRSINVYLSLDSHGERDWLEVVSDGKWLFLGYCFEAAQNKAHGFDNYYSYNPAFAHTADQIMEADFSDERIYTSLESGGQSPIPKIQALTDIEAGVKAVEYFIRTGERYPGIDWIHERS